MKCNKCGEEYKENQAFCLRCGNPIHVVPDFNLIEAELANDVGALMDDEINENSLKENDNSEPMKTVNVPVDDISMELKMVDINRGRFNFDDEELSLIDDDEEEEDDIEDIAEPVRKVENPPIKKISSPRPDPKKAPKKKNSTLSIVSNIAIIFGCIIAVILIFVVLWQVVSTNWLGDSSNFQKQYNIAKEHYDNNEKDEAIDEAWEAIDVARSDTEEIKARRLLNDIYVHYEMMEKDYLDNLLAIIALKPDDITKYNEAVLDYYYNNQMFVEFNELFAKLEGKGTTENMLKYLPEMPKTNYEKGVYDTFLDVQLTAAEGMTIYYTLDGSEPKGNVNALVYTEPIKLYSEGTTNLKAYAMDANGIISEVLKVEYIIGDVVLSGPVVTPIAGSYKEKKDITVAVPDGSKVYYTTDGTDPTEKSTEYKEPIEMPYGRSDYKFVCIDANGVPTSITSVTYNLTLDRVIKTGEGTTLVKDFCIKEKQLDENAKDINGLEYKFKYKDMLILNNWEYYLIEVTVENNTENTELEVPAEPEYYVINTNNKNILQATKTDGGYTAPEEEEETEE
ncbi:MAG: chitobiase/beta-hexosaminidase C-terminal domain-containing protein [Lachnospiraceae bacterium]|nr:chitobiase/beta-hexosaminidase C-terminal domain-containing protein [Lachnospiraceae bacterium]